MLQLPTHTGDMLLFKLAVTKQPNDQNQGTLFLNLYAWCKSCDMRFLAC